MLLTDVPAAVRCGRRFVYPIKALAVQIRTFRQAFKLMNAHQGPGLVKAIRVVSAKLSREGRPSESARTMQM